MAASGFFIWRRRSSSPRQLRSAWLTELVRTIHADAVVLDVFSGRAVGWSIDSHQPTPLVTNALGMAISNRSPGPDQSS